MSKSDCPFYAGSTITDPRLFVGRRDLLKILCDRLTGAQPTSINIVGRHRTGKSSLLLHFVNTYRQRIENPDRFLVVYLSLQSAACETQEKFYRAITQACLGNISSGLTPDVQSTLQTRLNEAIWDQFQLKFNELIQYLKQQKLLLVLCIDNFEELLERKEQFPNNFYDNLRSLIDSNALMVILASCEKLDDYSQQKQITSDFFNVFQYHDLNKGFTSSEAEELVSLSNSSGQSLCFELQKQALAWGKQEPYLLQLAAQNLWEVQMAGQTLQWAKQNFEAQANRISFQPKSPLLSTLYQGISKFGQACIWFIQNFENNKKFLVGLFVLISIFFIILALQYNLPVLDLLQAVMKKLMGG